MSAPLDPRAIEQEIARIREKESNPYSAGTKTNLFTLLVFRAVDAVAPGRADPAETALQYLLGRRPARIVTIVRTRAARTDAWVSGRCFPDKRNRGVCFEEVHIEAGDDGVGTDPGAWAPLLIRDLPVFAWMPDGPGAGSTSWDAAVKGAAGFIDKLLVDSSRPAPGAGGDVSALRALQLLRESTADEFAISDFSWRRIRVLREQSARAFNPGNMRPSLDSLRGARLRGGSSAEAALFFGWLQSRMGRDLRCEHAAEGPLAEGFQITFFIDGAPNLDIGCTKGGCLSRGEEKGGYRYPSDGEILREEVDTLARDPIFLDALTRAGRPDA